MLLSIEEIISVLKSKSKIRLSLLQSQTAQHTQTDRHKHGDGLQQQSTHTGSALVEP